MIRRRQLATFAAGQWTEGGDQPASREAVYDEYYLWRTARRECCCQQAPCDTPPPSRWTRAEEARALAEALAVLQRADKGTAA
jgi:hypothetical protein